MTNLDKWSEITPEQLETAAWHVEDPDLKNADVLTGATHELGEEPENKPIIAETTYGRKNIDAVHGEENRVPPAKENPHEGLAGDIMNFNRPF